MNNIQMIVIFEMFSLALEINIFHDWQITFDHNCKKYSEVRVQQ